MANTHSLVIPVHNGAGIIPLFVAALGNGRDASFTKALVALDAIDRMADDDEDYMGLAVRLAEEAAALVSRHGDGMEITPSIEDEIVKWTTCTGTEIILRPGWGEEYPRLDEWVGGGEVVAVITVAGSREACYRRLREVQGVFAGWSAINARHRVERRCWVKDMSSGPRISTEEVTR